MRAAGWAASIGGLAIVGALGLGSVVAVTSDDGADAPVVERSIATVQPIIETAELRDIYEDSMRQLQRCIDDRRSDPSNSGSSFPC